MKLPPKCPEHRKRAKGCARCNARHAAYIRERERLIRAGEWDGTQLAEPVRAHLAAILTGYGSVVAAERVSGVDEATIRWILNGKTERVLGVTAEALLALTAADVDRSRTIVVVDACGTRRRIRAAQWQGWTVKAIAEHLGRHYRTVEDWLLTETVSEATADLVRAKVGHDLAQRPGPSKAAAACARRAGHAPIWAWEDVDDPRCKPRRHTSALGRRMTDVEEQNVRDACRGLIPARQLTRSEKCEAIRQLVANERLTARQIANRLDWLDGDHRGAEAVRAFMYRNDLPSAYTPRRRTAVA